jgi:hypothetical protein
MQLTEGRFSFAFMSYFYDDKGHQGSCQASGTGLNGKVRYLFQGVTWQHARGVVGAAMDELDWEDTRLQDIHQGFGSGALATPTVSAGTPGFSTTAE